MNELLKVFDLGYTDDEVMTMSTEENHRIFNKQRADIYAAYRKLFNPEQDEFLREFFLWLKAEIGNYPEDEEFLERIKDSFKLKWIQTHKHMIVMRHWPYFIQPRQVSKEEAKTIAALHLGWKYSMGQLAYICQRSLATVQKHKHLQL